MSRWGALSLVAHSALWLALLFWPQLVGRPIQAPLEPAGIEVLIGDGGQTDEAAPAEPAPEPVPPQPEPVPLDALAPPIAVPPPPPPQPGRPAVVHLGEVGGPPHADLLDPDRNRFRAATQDTANRMPAYPREAALRLEAGTVKLQLFVDTSGMVANALVTRSSGSASLDAAARAQALTWRFTPAKRDGKPVADIVDIEIEFRLI